MEKSAGSTSPEFEFWMVGNPPSFPQPQDFLTADELFSDGVILPLIHPPSDPIPKPDSSIPSPATTDDTAAVAAPATPAMSTKKWRQFFRSRYAKRAAKAKATAATDAVKERAKFVAAAPSSSCSSIGSAAELNIHIWPFSRSRSAGNAAASAAARQRASAAGRRSYSAPCSRSNSRGESTAAAASAAGTKRLGPLAGGIPVGRSMPVWQLRRPAVKGGGGLSLNVNTCIGYGSSPASNCRGEDKDAVAVGDQSGAGDGGGRGRGGNGGSLFNLRAIFTKKVY